MVRFRRPSPRTSGPADPAVLAAARGGDAAAAAGLLERHGDLVWALARHVTGGPAPAGAAVRAAWAALLDGDEPAPPLPGAWLAATWAACGAVVVAEDRGALRWGAATVAVDDLPAGGRAAGELLERLHALPADERGAVVLDALGDGSPAADGAVLGIGAEQLVTLRARAHAALAGLPPAADRAEQAAREARVGGRPSADDAAGELLAQRLPAQRRALAAALATPLPADVRAALLAALPAPDTTSPAPHSLTPDAPGSAPHAPAPDTPGPAPHALAPDAPDRADADLAPASPTPKPTRPKTPRRPDEPWWSARPAHDPGWGPADPTDTRLRVGTALAVALVCGLLGFLGVGVLRDAADGGGDGVVTATPVGPLPPGVGAPR